MKKGILITVGLVVLIGGLIGYLFLQKAERGASIRYRGVRNPDTKTIYLADASNVTVAKTSVLSLLTGLSNRFDAIVWITTTPDSFSLADPYDPTITYRTADNATQAVTLAAKIMNDSGWINSAQERYLFHSFVLDDSTEELIRHCIKDMVFTSFTKVGYDYVPPRKK